jgi:hypothetical protein
MGAKGRHETGQGCLGSFLSFHPNADATGFEVYFSRFLSLALILTTIIMMLLIGTSPSPSTASEHVLHRTGWT